MCLCLCLASISSANSKTLTDWDLFVCLFVSDLLCLLLEDVMWMLLSLPIIICFNTASIELLLWQWRAERGKAARSSPAWPLRLCADYRENPSSQNSSGRDRRSKLRERFSTIHFGNCLYVIGLTVLMCIFLFRFCYCLFSEALWKNTACSNCYIRARSRADNRSIIFFELT